MAKTLKTIISSSSSPSPNLNNKISKKSHHFFLLSLALILFILIILPFVSSSGVNPSKPSSNMASNNLSRRTLFSDSSQKTMDFHPRKTRRNPKTKKGHEFEASDHEVPSGPNPISNSYIHPPCISLGISSLDMDLELFCLVPTNSLSLRVKESRSLPCVELKKVRDHLPSSSIFGV